MNMIVHRDYSHYGESSIKIFNDRIEFFNPGRLPDGISEDDLRKGTYVSSCRNKLIARVFKEITWIERYGTGVRRVTSLFERYGCPKPLFENFQHGFKVTAYPLQSTMKEKLAEKGDDAVEKTTEKTTEKATGEITEKPTEKVPKEITEKPTEKVTREITEKPTEKVTKEITEKPTEKVTKEITEKPTRGTTEKPTEKTTEKILQLIKDNPSISQEKIAEIIGITSDGVFWNIKKLKAKGILARIGSDKGGYWKVKIDTTKIE